MKSKLYSLKAQQKTVLYYVIAHCAKSLFVVLNSCIFLFFHHTSREKLSVNIPSANRETSPPPKNRQACRGTPGLTARPLYVWPLITWRRRDVSLESLLSVRQLPHVELMPIRRWIEATSVIYSFACLTSDKFACHRLFLITAFHKEALHK